MDNKKDYAPSNSKEEKKEEVTSNLNSLNSKDDKIDEFTYMENIHKDPLPMNTGFLQYDIYNIILTQYPKYSKLQVVDQSLLPKENKKEEEKRREEFIKNLYYDKLSLIEMYDTRNKYDLLVILLNSDEYDQNDIATVTDKFKGFKNLLKKKYSEFIIISPCEFDQRVKNHINTEPELKSKIFVYLYDVFKVVVPRLAFCSIHYVADEHEKEEYKTLFPFKQESDKKIIKFNDPQVVWLHAKPGDLIIIIRNSVQGGRAKEYRTVRR